MFQTVETWQKGSEFDGGFAPKLFGLSVKNLPGETVSISMRFLCLFDCDTREL